MSVINCFTKEKTKRRDLGGNVTRRIASAQGSMMICELTMEKGSVGAMHSHPHEQMTYIISGVYEFTIGDEKYVVKSGDVLYKQPNILHGAVCLESGKFLDIFTPQREDFILAEEKYEKEENK